MKNNFLKDLKSHITATYTDKYKGKNRDVISFLEDQHSLEDFAYGNIVKYVTRFRKQAEKRDLLKAGHYLQILYERCVDDGS